MEWNNRRMKNSRDAALQAVLWLVLLLAVLFMLSGCATLIPLGEEGKYGAFSINVEYLPPWPLSDPHLGGWSK